MENKEFFAALTDLVREKGISEEAFIETLANALASAYKKQYDGGAEVTVSLDAEKGTIDFKAARTRDPKYIKVAVCPFLVPKRHRRFLPNKARRSIRWG